MTVDHKPHPKPVQYVQIALVLGVLTAVEVVLYYTEDTVGVFTNPLLIILAVGKFEDPLINKFFTGGMILALILFAIVMFERAAANFI
jgi:hypothetical protein